MASKFPEKKKSIISDDGKINWVAIANMNMDTPGTEGRKLNQQMRDAVASVVFARLGSTMTDDAVDYTMKQFMPSAFDDADTIKDKMVRMDSFFSGNLEAINSAIPKEFRKKQDKKTVDYNDLPP